MSDRLVVHKESCHLLNLLTDFSLWFVVNTLGFDIILMFTSRFLWYSTFGTSYLSQRIYRFSTRLEICSKECTVRTTTIVPYKTEPMLVQYTTNFNKKRCISINMWNITQRKSSKFINTRHTLQLAVETLCTSTTNTNSFHVISKLQCMTSRAENTGNYLRFMFMRGRDQWFQPKLFWEM